MIGYVDFEAPGWYEHLSAEPRPSSVLVPPETPFHPNTSWCTGNTCRVPTP